MKLKSAFAVALLLSSMESLAASTATSNLTVTATVVAACNVSAGTLNFGSVDPLSLVEKSGTGNIGVTCTKGTSYVVALNAGNSGSSITNRQMKSTSSDLLQYALYRDSSNTQPWGDSTGGTVTVSRNGTGAQELLTVYGVVPAAQAVSAGDYTDTVVVSVNFGG